MTNLEFTQPIRCYDGAFDSASQRVLDAQAEALKRIREVEPDAICTYFPSESQYVVHAWGRTISAYCSTRGSALADALEKLHEPR
jgi:hypothetical protein